MPWRDTAPRPRKSKNFAAFWMPTREMRMAGLDSWLSADVMHALGWALIHSLWQGLSVAALAAALMAFSRRPSIRYLIAVGALALMLAAPVATFFLLMKAGASAHAVSPAPPSAFVFANPSTANVAPAANAPPASGPERPRRSGIVW